MTPPGKQEAVSDAAMEASKNGFETPRADALRRKAQQQLDGSLPAEGISDTSVRALLNELQVHQIEMEMQNEELQRAQAAAIESSRREVAAAAGNRRKQETTLDLLRLLNDPNNTRELIRSLTEYLQQWSGCEAVGIRLRDGNDFPYFETRGFPAEFVEAENHLCLRDADGKAVRDPCGNPVLECMCGNVLCGRFDPALPFFTP